MEKLYKYRYTYKIICLKGSLAGHYYFGQHRTNNLNDGYVGSGRIISDYYKKYGKIEHQTYIKEIIAFYNSIEELNQAEFELIGDKYNTDPLCLNLRAGGNQHKGYSDETIKLMALSKKGKKPWITGKHHSQITKDRLSQYSPWTKGKPSTIKGKHRIYREDGSFYFE